MRAVVIASLIFIGGAAHPADAPPEARKAVLVTGASTGIGRNITEYLAAKGYVVYAGARKDADLKALGTIKNVRPIRLDVTKPEDIAAAVDTVTKAGSGLYALVNNAGIASVGTVTATKIEEFDLIMKVNVYGPFRVTQAFAPLLIAAKGRVANIGSVAGIVAPPPVAAYSMTKHALEAFGDTLAGELEPQGVKVSIIEPGNYNSELGKNAVQRTGVEGRLTDRSKYKQPDEVAAAVELALFEATPKRRYLVTPNQEEAERTIRKQIEQLVQLNEDHAYTYDREALVRMLDDALGKARPQSQAAGTR